MTSQALSQWWTSVPSSQVCDWHRGVVHCFISYETSRLYRNPLLSVVFTDTLFIPAGPTQHPRYKFSITDSLEPLFEENSVTHIVSYLFYIYDE